MLSIQRGPLLGVGDDFRQNLPDLIGSEIEGRDILSAGKRHLAYSGFRETRSGRLLFRRIEHHRFFLPSPLGARDSNADASRANLSRVQEVLT
jgi:hypothetical protein